jgi:hypothetical protein
MKKRIIIGIDPDVDMSGVARVDSEGGKVWADHLPFPLLIDYLLTIKHIAKMQQADLLVYVEASWLISHNWHISQKDSKALAGARGKSIGAMQQVGKLILEMCAHHGITGIEQPPLKKVWKGRDGKITHEEITQVTGWERKRSNQEERDALLIAWNASGKPIKVRI